MIRMGLQKDRRIILNISYPFRLLSHFYPFVIRFLPFCDLSFFYPFAILFLSVCYPFSILFSVLSSGASVEEC